MGQQQLLLIVLGVIVVGIAIVVGINLFNANAQQANRDGVISDLQNLAAMAQAHFKKPAAMGGGGNSFTNSNGGTAWAIPANLATTPNGTYAITTTGAASIVITGTGNQLGNDAENNVSATMTVTANAATVAVVN